LGCVAVMGWVGLSQIDLKCQFPCPQSFVPSSTFGSVKSRRVYNFVWMLIGVILPLGCLLVAGTKLVQVLRALRQRNEIDTARHGRGRRYRSRPSPVTTTVVGTAVSFILLVCPSIVVESNKPDQSADPSARQPDQPDIHAEYSYPDICRISWRVTIRSTVYCSDATILSMTRYPVVVHKESCT